MPTQSVLTPVPAMSAHDHVQRFLAAVHGIAGHHVTKALTMLTPGNNWCGCGKVYMAERYAGAMQNRPYGYLGDNYLRALDLERLGRMARARQVGDHNWRNARPPPIPARRAHHALLPLSEL